MLTEKEATVMPRCSDWEKDREKKESQRSYYWNHYMPVGFPYTIIWHTWGRKVIQYIVYKLRTKEHMLSHYSFEDTGLIYLCISTAVCVCMRVCVNMCVYTHGYPETVKCNFIWMIKQKYSVHFFFFFKLLSSTTSKGLFFCHLETCLILLNLQISLLGHSGLFTAGNTEDPEAPSRNHLEIPWRNWICLLQFLGFRPSEAFLCNIASGGQWTAVISVEGKYVQVTMSYFHCKCRDFKYENIQNSFQDFNQK